MGRRRVEQLVLALAVGDALPAEPTRGFQAARFWTAAARRAAIGRGLAELLCPADVSATFTAALLQDLAVPLLAHAGPGGYDELLADWQNGARQSLSALEQAEFGWDHSDVGAFISEKWRFPESLVANIGDHHDEPARSPDAATVARLVSHIREDDEDSQDDLIETVRGFYGVPVDRIARAIEDGNERAGELAAMFAG